MFTDPTGLAAARRQNTGGFGSYGEAIWDAICYVGLGGAFTRRDVVDELLRERENKITEVTAERYITAFFAYARAAPEDFSGPASKIVRLHKGVYRLKDNPER